MMVSAEQPRPTVLVVDDDLQMREMLPRLLELEGYIVESTPDGSAAVARLARGG
jgi:CheY-like chemotaxis protein